MSGAFTLRVPLVAVTGNAVIDMRLTPSRSVSSGTVTPGSIALAAGSVAFETCSNAVTNVSLTITR